MKLAQGKPGFSQSEAAGTGWLGHGTGRLTWKGIGLDTLKRAAFLNGCCKLQQFFWNVSGCSDSSLPPQIVLRITDGRELIKRDLPIYR